MNVIVGDFVRNAPSYVGDLFSHEGKYVGNFYHDHQLFGLVVGILDCPPWLKDYSTFCRDLWVSILISSQIYYSNIEYIQTIHR